MGVINPHVVEDLRCVAELSLHGTILDYGVIGHQSTHADSVGKIWRYGMGSETLERSGDMVIQEQKYSHV